MSTVEIRRELLELEKLRQELETELARRHNWAQQEAFWAHEAKMSRGRNYIALAAIVAALTATVTAALAKLL
ncbi:MAG: hypothetical protein ACT4QB_01695 [Gammaproteobacteria bacterium]